MTREEAEIYAQNMSYRDAISNLWRAKSIPYRKATFIKLRELVDGLDKTYTKEEVVAILVALETNIIDYLDTFRSHGKSRDEMIDDISGIIKEEISKLKGEK